jgi:hypothetical protein
LEQPFAFTKEYNMQDDRVVYVVNDGGHDYSDALRFGELEFLTRGTLDKFDTSTMYRECLSGLTDSTPEDYLLITSLTSLCSVASAMFAAMHGRLNLLIYKEGQYVLRAMAFNQGHNT